MENKVNEVNVGLFNLTELQLKAEASNEAFNLPGMTIEQMMVAARDEPEMPNFWGKPLSDRRLEILFNVSDKLLPLMRQNPEITFNVKKLFRPTPYGATHICSFRENATAASRVDDTTIAIIENGNFSDFDFNISPDVIAPFLTRRRDTVWLRLLVYMEAYNIIIKGA